MVWIIVPVRRVKRIVYCCPRCGKRERFFFSLLPLLKPEWRCRGCRAKYKIKTTGAFASNWRGVFVLYSLPLNILVAELAAVANAFRQNAMFPTPNFSGTLLRAVFFSGPLLMLLGVLIIGIIGYIAGGIYGLFAVNR